MFVYSLVYIIISMIDQFQTNSNIRIYYIQYKPKVNNCDFFGYNFIIVKIKKYKHMHINFNFMKVLSIFTLLIT